MVLAELEAYFSRPIAPTRRVALGDRYLPVNPAPGFGGVLLGGVAARFAQELDSDEVAEIYGLALELEHRDRLPQPRLRHRFQTDRIGLQLCTHRLIGLGETLEFELEDHIGTPAQQVLAAVYAAGATPAAVRSEILSVVRIGLTWRGAIGDRLLGALSGTQVSFSMGVLDDPFRWALAILDLRALVDEPPSKREVIQAFRDGLRDAHPDHGGGTDDAAERIAELTEARRILLGA